MQRLQAPGTRAPAAGGLTVLGGAIHRPGAGRGAGRCRRGGRHAEANHMEIVAASLNVITASPGLRGDSARPAAMWPERSPPSIPPKCGLVSPRARRALGVAALADGSYLPAFTQLPRAVHRRRHAAAQLQLPTGSGGPRDAAIRADRRMRRTHIIEHELSRLRRNGLSPARAPSPARAASSAVQRGRSQFRQGARRSRRGPVAIRAGAASG